MAGNDEHDEALQRAYPNAKSVECDGNGRSATVTYPDGYVQEGKCAGCARERLSRELVNFIPPRFRSTINLPDGITDWAERGREAEGLYLAGPVGTGKTHAAWMALAKWCLATGTFPQNYTVDGWGTGGPPPIIFTRLTDLLDELRPGDHARNTVRNCQGTSLLVIDDLGAEKASEWTQERLYSVIDERYAKRLPLLVTSNLPPSKVTDQTGERVASRLAEMCTVVAMTGTDRRKSAA